MSNLHKILLEGNGFTKIVANLKQITPRYPEILNSYAININTVYLSTMVRIKREEKWYLVHCVEKFIPLPDHEVECVETGYRRLIRSVHNIQYLYKVGTWMEDLDPDQRSEEERLREMMPKY